MLLACKERDKWKSQDETQQMTNDLQAISKILLNQSLANLPKPNQKLQMNKEEENEDEEMA